MKRTFFVHKFCFDVLPRWLRRKLKKLRSSFVQIPKRVTRVALVSVVLAAGGIFFASEEVVYAQTTIGNNRDRQNEQKGSLADNPPYWDNGSAGRPGTWEQVSNWWGRSTTDNVIVYLNANSTGGTVRVTHLDNWTDYYEYSGGSTARNWTPHTYGPDWNNQDHIYTGSGTVTINSGTTHLNTSVNTDVHNYGTGNENFRITGVTKAGGGTLSLEIQNMEITNFTGALNGGTLLLANDANGDGELDQGTLKSTTALLQGGTTPTFTFSSEDLDDNVWTITTLTGQGFNNYGHIITTTNATLDATTNVGGLDGFGNPSTTNVGWLDMTTGHVGTNTSIVDNVVNINSGRLTTSGLFTVGEAAGTTSVVNHTHGQEMSTGTGGSTTVVGAIIGQGGDKATVNVGGSLWKNTGIMIVGDTTKGNLNISSTLAQGGGNSNYAEVRTDRLEVGRGTGGDDLKKGDVNVWGNGSLLKVNQFTTVGSLANGHGSIRVENKASMDTDGLYIGVAAGSSGTVSILNEGTVLNVYEDTINTTPITIAGSGTLSVSDQATTEMYADSRIQVGGNIMFSNAALLHMYGGSTIISQPAGTHGGKISFSNARLLGIGTLDAVDGVFFTQDGGHGLLNSQAVIDPGLVYGWGDHNEDVKRYGTLTFNNSSGLANASGLVLTGNVITNFDVNSGDIYGSGPFPYGDHDQDLLVVTGGNAALSGTLKLHARATDYYAQGTDLRYEIVQTQNGGNGTIDSLYDTVDVLPSRFFRGVTQIVDESSAGGGNQSLYLSMYRNENPFYETGQTYNQKQTGMGLDSVYNLDLYEWFPVLRSFWYMGEDETREILSFWSGEVRAHSLLLPVQSPWRYANNRVGFNKENGHVFFGGQNRAYYRPYVDPCGPSICGANLKTAPSNGSGLWGTAIYDYADTNSDGNAGGYQYSRIGFVVGIDKAYNGGRSYIGAMFGYDQGDLDMTGSNAKSDDFFFGLYHGKRIGNGFEWKNYLGMGMQNYDINRSMMLWVGIPNSSGGWDDEPHHISANAGFGGFTFAGSTELARPFYFGEYSRWMLRPYMGLDINATWQDEATESGNDPYSNLVILKYYSATNVRTYFRTGLDLERGGDRGNLRTGLYGSYLFGGRRYTNVDNQFVIGQPYGVGEFNIRGVNDGSARINWHAGANLYLSQNKEHIVSLDYLASAGKHSTVHSMQLGYQKIF